MDQHLHNQVVKQIIEYDGTLDGLGALIADLEAVWSVEEWDERNHAEFRKQWEILEQTNALIYDRNPPLMTEEDVREVRNALECLREVLPPPI